MLDQFWAIGLEFSPLGVALEHGMKIITGPYEYASQARDAVRKMTLDYGHRPHVRFFFTEEKPSSV